MSSQDFTDWLAAWKHEPWGEDRRDLQLAKVCQTTDAAAQGVMGAVAASVGIRRVPSNLPLSNWFVYGKKPEVKPMKETDLKTVVKGIAARWNQKHG